MIEIPLLILLAVVLFAGPGLDRSFVIHGLFVATVFAGSTLMLYQQDWIVLAGWTLLCTNMLRRPYPMQHQARLSMFAGLYAVYAFVPPIHTDWMLMGMTALLVVFSLSWSSILFAHLNFRDMLCTVGVACTVALALKGHVLWLVALIPLLFPLFAFRKITRVLQAHLWIAGIACLALMFWSPWVALVPVILAVAWGFMGPASSAWSIRWQAWRTFILVQWRYGWTERLFGMGHDAWAQWADALAGLEKQKTGKRHIDAMTNPHNEYVSILFEHGLIGLFVFLAWACSLLYHAWRSDPPLLLPGLTIAAMGLTLFPWTFPREMPVQGKTWVQYEPFGHMSTLILSLLIAILLRGAS